MFGSILSRLALLTKIYSCQRLPKQLCWPWPPFWPTWLYPSGLKSLQCVGLKSWFVCAKYSGYSCKLSKPQDLKVGKKLMSGPFWTKMFPLMSSFSLTNIRGVVGEVHGQLDRCTHTWQRDNMSRSLRWQGATKNNRNMQQEIGVRYQTDIVLLHSPDDISKCSGERFDLIVEPVLFAQRLHQRLHFVEIVPRHRWKQTATCKITPMRHLSWTSTLRQRKDQAPTTIHDVITWKPSRDCVMQGQGGQPREGVSLWGRGSAMWGWWWWGLGVYNDDNMTP